MNERISCLDEEIATVAMAEEAQAEAISSRDH